MTTAMQRFLPSRLRSNPLVMRTLRQPAKLRVVWWLVAILSLFSFVGTLFYKDTLPFLAVGLLEVLLLLANPIFASWTAATVICLEIKAEQYELVMVTTLSNMKLVEGHIFAVFYRLRLPLILTLALLPSLVVRLIEYAYTSYSYCVHYDTDCLRTIVLSQSLFYSLILFGAIGVLIFGIVVAMILALWWRNQYAAGIGATTIVISLIVLFFRLANRTTTNKEFIALLATTISYMMLLYFAAIGIMLVAQVVARRRP